MAKISTDMKIFSFQPLVNPSFLVNLCVFWQINRPVTLKPAPFTMDKMLKISLTLILLFVGMGSAMGAGKGRTAAGKAKSANEFVVVIDAGHGGKDPGCVGKNAKEKNITLNVAKSLGKKIADNCQNVKVVYTRSDDRYLTLKQRANVANRNKGHLFISIHVNSLDYDVPGRENTTGASVYTVGVEKEQSTLGIAMRENAVMELEDDYSTKYSGFDPKSAESYIIFELNNNMHCRQSLQFANMVQTELTSTAGREDKKVRQAGFWVLWATTMPSVLVELDFICNPDAEQFLASKDGVDKCSDALYNAFKKYHAAYMAGQKKI